MTPLFIFLSDRIQNTAFSEYELTYNPVKSMVSLKHGVTDCFSTAFLKLKKKYTDYKNK